MIGSVLVREAHQMALYIDSVVDEKLSVVCPKIIPLRGRRKQTWYVPYYSCLSPKICSSRVYGKVGLRL